MKPQSEVSRVRALPTVKKQNRLLFVTAVSQKRASLIKMKSQKKRPYKSKALYLRNFNFLN